MNRIGTVIFLLLVLGFIIQDLDALKAQASARNGPKRAEKRRYKRQYNVLPFGGGYSPFACGLNGLGSCPIESDFKRNVFSFQRAITTVQRHRFFYNGLVSLSALQNGGMCLPNSNLLTSNAFAALTFGHITLPQLATLQLLPVPSVDMTMLQSARYVSTFGQNTLLTGLGLQASLFGHILPSQLQPLNLYPAQGGVMTSDVLMQAHYLTSDCIPTALGLSAMHIHYLPMNNLGALGCPMSDYSQVTMEQLVTAGYVYGTSNLLTPVGLAAYHVGLFSRDLYQQFNIFPFAASAQTVSADLVDTEQNGYFGVVNDFIHAGYIHASSRLLTGAAYYAISKDYFSIEQLRTVGVWPCSIVPTMSAFVSAGYATYSGHLTVLGYSLLHAQYFPVDWLSKLGIHLHSEYHLFHAALSYSGLVSSEYHTVHSSIHAVSAAGYGAVAGTNYGAAQVVQSQSVSSSDVSTAGESAVYAEANQ